MKVHAVKLEYRRLKLETMLRGHFRVINGKRYVYITFDPLKPKINSKHPRKLNASTKLGQKYSEIINDYQRIKAEYIELLNSWNSLYNFSPPRVKFPIRQFYDPHRMNNDYFDAQADFQGKYKSDNPTRSDHGELKSKNELMVADLLKTMGIPFKYETQIYLQSIDETINPDYLISFYEIDRCTYLEVLGMSDKLDYSFRTTSKINGFSKDIYRPGREVIYIHLYDKQNFDGDYVASQILSAFNDMIPDDAILWKTESEAV